MFVLYTPKQLKAEKSLKKQSPLAVFLLLLFHAHLLIHALSLCTHASPAYVSSGGWLIRHAGVRNEEGSLVVVKGVHVSKCILSVLGEVLVQLPSPPVFHLFINF